MATFLPILAAPTLPASVFDAAAVYTQSLSLEPPALIASFPSSTHVLSHILSLSFNGRQFYCLSDVFAHICNYPKKQDCVHLYIDVICQISQIFDMDTAFASGFINAIKKDKSYEIES